MPEDARAVKQMRTLQIALMEVSSTVTEIHIDDYIAKEKERNWWTGEVIGTEVTSKEFIEQLDGVTTPEVVVVINSGGGDVWEGAAIANAIRDKRRDGMKITAKVPALCASAAMDIACACESVSIYRNAYMMIHEARGGAWGREEDLRSTAEMLKTMNSAVAQNYSKKCGESMEQVLQWMNETKWFCGQEALDAGFADVLLDEETEQTVTEPQDPQQLFLLNGAAVAATDISRAPAALKALMNKRQIKNQGQEGDPKMAEIKTIEEMKQEYPALCKQMEDAAAEVAVKQERSRMKALDAVADKVPAEMMEEAKYDKPCDAQAVVYQAVKDGKLVNSVVLGQLAKDARPTGEVPAGANGGTPEGTAQLTTDEKHRAEARASFEEIAKARK